jgi:hypothetical protein
VIVAQAATGCGLTTAQEVQSMTIKQDKPSKALVRSVRARIEKLRDEQQQHQQPQIEVQ